MMKKSEKNLRAVSGRNSNSSVEQPTRHVVQGDLTGTKEDRGHSMTGSFVSEDVLCEEVLNKGSLHIIPFNDSFSILLYFILFFFQ